MTADRHFTPLKVRIKAIQRRIDAVTLGRTVRTLCYRTASDRRYHHEMSSTTETLSVTTRSRDQLVEMTTDVQYIVARSGVQSGQAVVFVPHTTAGVTINENADPDVVHDMIAQLDLMVPWEQPFYRHNEGNSAAHVKASMVGSSVTVLIEAGHLVLGTWQGIYFCEFDGPRSRSVLVKLMADSA